MKDIIVEEIDHRILTIKSDARFNYPPATTDENAPLALVQVALESRFDELTSLRAFVIGALNERSNKDET